MKRFLLFSAFMACYIVLAYWVNAIAWQPTQLVLEIPLIIYLYITVNALTRANRFQIVSTTLLLLAPYVLFDGYVYFTASVPKPIDINLLPEQLGGVSNTGILILWLLVIGPAVLLLANLQFPVSKKALIFLLPVVVNGILLLIFPEPIVVFIEKWGSDVQDNSAKQVVAKNGRYVGAIYFEAKRREILRSLNAHKNTDKLDIAYYGRVFNKVNNRNVHIILLENLPDVASLEELPTNQNPTNILFNRLVGSELGSSIFSPSGTRRANAEFEALCGAQAYQALSAVEYKVFTGSQTSCLSHLLRQLGYLTVATNAYRFEQYNSLKAYQAMGFSKIFFPEIFGDRGSYLQWTDTPGGFLFDASLLQQNSRFMEEKVHHASPLLNFVVGVGSGADFSSADRIRPAVVKTREDLHRKLEGLFNAQFYRTHAIADYIVNLKNIDEKSLIIITGSTIPKKLYASFDADEKLKDKITQANIQTTPLLIVKNGKLEKRTAVKQYKLFYLVLDYITDGRFCKQEVCELDRDVLTQEARFNKYLELMALAMR